MKVTLTVSEGNPRAVVVDSPEFLIGRAADCDLRLRNPWISRHHCLLTIQDDQVFVRDLRSINGTGVNNQVLVGERPLRDGDDLWLAATPIRVRIQSDRDSWRKQVHQTLEQRRPCASSARSAALR
ncbi:MAG: FHA domain-containing protein [Pirellulaceae bacterium]|nr:FHA domain-containing protein [Pirellulaceae bacterium]